MTRTLKVLIGAAALAIIGVSTASAQTGPLLGRELYLFDGGSDTTQNTVRLIAPPADTIANSWTFTLPRNAGGTNFIMVNKDGLGTTEWEDGLSLFWGIEGNCDPILPWNGTSGNYIGHCLNNIDFRSGDSFMNFWFNDQTTPRLVLDSNGRMLLNVVDGSEGLVIGGNGPNGPDAGIVLDCAFPPTVGIEVNALATGILMPTCATAPLVGISIQAQTTGLEIDSSGNTGILISESLTGINVTGTTHSINATGTVRLNTVAADASATQVLARNGSNDVVYRSIAATGTIVTTPAGGTVNTLPLWTPSSTELGNSIVTQDGAGTLVSVGGALTVTGATTLQGTVTVDPADITLDALDTRILSIDGASGLVGYRTIPANGDIVVSNGPLTNNGAVYTNSTGQLQSVALTNGQVLIGSTGNAPVASTLTAGSGVTITNAAGSITIAVTNPAPAGTTNNSTLRWNTGTSTWQENINLLSTAAGNTTNNGTLTLSVANTVLDASDTRILTQDAATGLVGHRTVAATGDIVTAPIAGTTGRITRWTASNQIGDGSLDDNGTGTLSRTGNIAVNPGAANTLSTNGIFTAAGNVTLGDAAADVVTLSGATVDITNVPSTASSTNLLRRNATGDIEVSTLTFATIPGGSLAANRNVRTDGSGGLTVGAINLAGGANEVSGILPAGNGGTGVDGSAAANGTLLIGNGAGYTLATLTAGTGISITNGAGTITVAASGELLPTGTLNDATLRWNGTDWVENTNLLSTAAGNTTINGTVTVDVADVTLDAANTRLLSIDAASGLVGYREVPANGSIVTSNGTLGNNAAVRTNASGQLETATLANGQILIGAGAGAPVAANITSSGSTVTITNGAGTINLEVANPMPAANVGNTNWTLRSNGTAWVASGTLTNDGTNVQTTGSLTVGNNLTVGDLDGDQTNIRGAINLNSVGTNPNAAAANVNISTTAFANVTTIGNVAAGNTINLDAPVIVAANLPAGANTDNLVTIDAAGNLRESTVATMIGGTPWLRGGNAGALSGVLGTTDAVDVALTAGGVSHINLVTATQATNINTTATGNVTIGANTVNNINLNSDEIFALNIPANNSTNYILVYDNTTGQIGKKDLGAPIQKSKTAQATITGAPPARVFTIADTFVATGATITVTLQDGTDANDYTVTLPAANIVNNVSFTVRLSGVVGAGLTKLVHYTITNP
ncbi:MAG: hypothetical protein EHM43_01415 [Ignavibacteriae bacterium]|nr:MAG: hypothetical protein EHM43_01415 [Ignavibacteriota bacterium]